MQPEGQASHLAQMSGAGCKSPPDAGNTGTCLRDSWTSTLTLLSIGGCQKSVFFEGKMVETFSSAILWASLCDIVGLIHFR